MDLSQDKRMKKHVSRGVSEKKQKTNEPVLCSNSDPFIYSSFIEADSFNRSAKNNNNYEMSNQELGENCKRFNSKSQVSDTPLFKWFS